MRYMKELSVGEKLFVILFFIMMILYLIFITWKDEVNMEIYDNTIIKDQIYETSVYVDYIDRNEEYVIFTYDSKDIYDYSKNTYYLCEDKENQFVECFLRVVQLGDGRISYTVEEVKNK